MSELDFHRRRRRLYVMLLVVSIFVTGIAGALDRGEYRGAPGYVSTIAAVVRLALICCNIALIALIVTHWLGVARAKS